MKELKVVGILCADIHLSHKPPVWRSNEPDWYTAMARPLDEMKELQAEYKCPVLCAGDIFDNWNSPAELINWAIYHLPPCMYTIPGQHDLPEHSIKNIYRSAYETLSRAETILSLSCPATCPSISTSQYTLSPFPFDTKIKPLLNDYKTTINIAIVHDYVCTARTAHPKAPKEAYIGKTSNSNLINGKLYGYDVIVYGDNHKSFLTHVGKTVIWNCGTLMRRKSDEVDYKPRVGLLFSNGKVEPYYLDVSKDKHLTAEEVKDVEDVEEQDMEVFAEELRKLGASALDFAEAMKEFWRSDKTRKAVRRIIQKAMEK